MGNAWRASRSKSRYCARISESRQIPARGRHQDATADNPLAFLALTTELQHPRFELEATLSQMFGKARKKPQRQPRLLVRRHEAVLHILKSASPTSGSKLNPPRSDLDMADGSRTTSSLMCFEKAHSEASCASSLLFATRSATQRGAAEKWKRRIRGPSERAQDAARAEQRAAARRATLGQSATHARACDGTPVACAGGRSQRERKQRPPTSGGGASAPTLEAQVATLSLCPCNRVTRGAAAPMHASDPG